MLDLKCYSWQKPPQKFSVRNLRYDPPLRAPLAWRIVYSNLSLSTLTNSNISCFIILFPNDTCLHFNYYYYSYNNSLYMNNYRIIEHNNIVVWMHYSNSNNNVCIVMATSPLKSQPSWRLLSNRKPEWLYSDVKTVHTTLWDLGISKYFLSLIHI